MAEEGAPGSRKAASYFNTGFAGVLVAIAITILWETYLSGREIIGVSAPAVFPTILAGLLVLLSVLLVIATLRGTLPADHVAEKVSIAANLRSLAVFAVTCAYVLLLEAIGFYIATPVAIFLVAIACGERRYMLLLTFTAVFSAVVFVFFSRLLHVPLPIGIAEIWRG